MADPKIALEYYQSEPTIRLSIETYVQDGHDVALLMLRDERMTIAIQEDGRALFNVTTASNEQIGWALREWVKNNVREIMERNQAPQVPVQ